MKIFERSEVVVITGASQGIGEACAVVAAQEGAGGVAVSGRRRDRTEAVAAKIRQQGVRAFAWVGDLSKPGKAEEFVKATAAEFGRIDVLINNLGKSDRGGVLDMTPEFVEDMFQTNVFPTMFATKAAIEEFIRLGIDGSIVTNSSMNAFCGQDNLAVYAATKGAITSFTRTTGHTMAMRCAAALDKGGTFPWIRVNGFYTGWIASEGEWRYKQMETPDAPQNWHETPPLSGVPSGEMTSVEEVAKQFLFLSSRHCRNINAQMMPMEQFALDGPPNRSIDGAPSTV